jgi:signal transduction histidine kinase
MIFEKIELEPNEEIVEIVRKHWFVLVKDLFATGIVLFAPLLLSVFFQAAKDIIALPNLEAYSSLLLFFAATWMLVAWMMLAYSWTNYYLDLWVITNRRIILVDQRGFFRRFISSFRLERLQDMNIEINGIIATLLDYGTIEAQTAGGSNEEFTSNYMPHPREIKSKIIRFADNIATEVPQREKNLREQGL